jgi:antitoxin HicB
MSTTTWTYGASITRERGDFVVSVRDLPEVVTSGSTQEEALELAADAIEVIVEGRLAYNEAVPLPSRIRKREHAVSLPAHLAAKAAVYTAWKDAGVSKSELARRLRRNETEVRRILDPHHGTKLDQLEEAARALGGRLVVSFEAA